MRNLRQQIEEILGREIKVFTQEQLAEGFQLTPKEFHERIDMNTRVVDIPELIRGNVRPSRPVIFVISQHRGGFLIHLRELMKEPA